jgi:hypothetical protein
MAGFKSELAADIISETVADLRRNQHSSGFGACPEVLARTLADGSIGARKSQFSSGSSSRPPFIFF